MAATPASAMEAQRAGAPAGKMPEVPTAQPRPTQEAQEVQAPPKPGAPVKVPRVPEKEGLNRVYWDLKAEGPVRWMETKKFNRGPKAGALVPPGSYTATLVLGKQKLTQRFEVVNDLNSRVPQADLVAQYNFEEDLFGEISELDVALNRLDAMRAQVKSLQQAVKGTADDAVIKSAVLPFDKSAQKVEDAITGNPQAIEDMVRKPDRLREHLFVLESITEGGDGAPTAAEVSYQQSLQREYQDVVRQYNTFLSSDVAAFNRTMASHKLPGLVTGAPLK